MKELFKFDLTGSTTLLDDEGLMTKPVKRDLCSELEKGLSPDEYKHPSEWDTSSTADLVDVMET